jgi:CRISPR-associated protein Cmr5
VTERSLPQRRAEHALAAIDALNNTADAKVKTAYRSYVRSLPATIVMAGLGQAVAMLLARGKDGEGNQAAYKQLHDHLSAWLLCKDSCCPCADRPEDGTRLIDRIVKGSQDDYLLAQAEALAYLDWLKKLATALLVEERTANDGAARIGGTTP